jgi:parvulin-like peptidyl-prolyl isomerase
VNKEIDRIRTSIGSDAFERQLKEKGMTFHDYHDRIKDQMIIVKYIDSLIPKESITEQEMMEFYKKSPKMFINHKKVLVRIMQTATKEEADEILKEMKEKKMSFDEMADRFAKEKAGAVTDYGWTETSFFSPEIANALLSLQKGSYGGPYKGRDGYFILRVKDRKDETPMTYNEAKDKIKSVLSNQRRQAAVAHLIAEAKKNASIKVYIK